jgi:hypothetical protein
MARMADPKVYTIQEANRQLPDLNRAIQSLRRLQEKVRNLSARLDVLDLVCDRFVDERNPDLRQYLSAKVRYHRKIGQLHGILRELEAKGCYVQDLKGGVVHFAARRGDDPVLLCWREGEKEVLHWHAAEDHAKPEDEAPRHKIEAWDRF